MYRDWGLAYYSLAIRLERRDKFWRMILDVVNCLDEDDLVYICVCERERKIDLVAKAVNA